MNNTYQLLKTLKTNAEEMLSVDFYKNLRSFKYLLDERFIASACELDMFLKALPDYLLDIIDDKDSVINFFANADEVNNGKIFSIKPLDNEGIGVEFMFSNNGKLAKIIFYNDRLKLTLSNEQDVVVLERKNSCIKLVSLFKDHYALNKSSSVSGEFRTVDTIQKSKVERDILYNEMLLG